MINIEISKSKNKALENLKRVVIITEYVKSYSGQYFSIPYSLEHQDENGVTINDINIKNGNLIASNETILFINKDGTVNKTENETTTPMGMFDYFIMLQKNIPEEDIITTEILKLDSSGYFD